MRTSWNIVSFLAVVHLLALLLVAGWLWQSDRLNGDRVTALRELLQPTITEEMTAAKKASAEMEAEQERRLADARKAAPGMPSDEQIQQISLVRRQELRTRERLASDRDLLLTQLEDAERKFAERERAFAAERAAWERSIAETKGLRTDEQFQQAVKQLESIPPKQAKEIIEQLTREGEIEQAVRYLDAMNGRASAKIIKEFKTEPEIVLATELLERLRTLGISPSSADGAGAKAGAAGQSNADDEPVADAAGPTDPSTAH